MKVNNKVNNDKKLLEGLVRKYGTRKLMNTVNKINESINEESIMVDIEFYKDGDTFCAYIGEENYSGMECYGDTIEEMLDEVKDYLLDRLND